MNGSAEEQLRAAGGFLLSRVDLRPTVGVILGSGLAGIATEILSAQSVPFDEIPHLAKPTVAGHPGRLVAGTWQGQTVAALQGRLHPYEGYSPWEVTFPVRLLHLLGVRTLIITNAAGALNPDLRTGDLVLISDHICLPALCGDNPLGALGAAFGPRFVGMTEAYDPGLQRLAAGAAASLGMPVRSGVYIMVSGPSYETAAELRMLRGLGGDVVGMSSATEVIVATQLGLRVLGIGCVTNQASGAGAHDTISHGEVLAEGQAMAPRVAALIGGVLAALPRGE